MPEAASRQKDRQVRGAGWAGGAPRNGAPYPAPDSGPARWRQRAHHGVPFGAIGCVPVARRRNNTAGVFGAVDRGPPASGVGRGFLQAWLTRRRMPMGGCRAAVCVSASGCVLALGACVDRGAGAAASRLGSVSQRGERKLKRKKGNQQRRAQGRRRAPYASEGLRGLGERTANGRKWAREAGPQGRRRRPAAIAGCGRQSRAGGLAEKVSARGAAGARREEGGRRGPDAEAGPRGGFGGSSPRKAAAAAKRENGPKGAIKHAHPASAGVPGLEPRLTGPEPVGLPITPYPNTAAESRSRQHTLAEISLGRERKRHWPPGRQPGGPANGRGRAGPWPRVAAASCGGR